MDLGWVISDINVGVLYIFAISSLSVYGSIMAGWSSNSKYPFLAALRSAAQMVSYEVSIGFVIITVLLCAGSLNLSAVVEAQNTHGLGSLIGLPRLTFLNWYWLPLLPMFVVFYVSALAEAIVPRYGYDQLMRLGWKVFLPLSLAMVVIVAGVLHFAGIAPT